MIDRVVAAHRRHRKHAEQVACVRLVSAMRSRLDELRERAAHVSVSRDRLDLVYAIDAVGTTLGFFAMCDDRPHPVAAVGLLTAAVDDIRDALGQESINSRRFEHLFSVAFRLGLAVSTNHEAGERSQRAVPKHSASQQLRQLAKDYPGKSAGALRRILEERTGGRMDDSAARAVVRKVRAPRSGVKS